MSAEKTTEPDEVLTDDELQAAAAPEQSIEEDDKPRKRTVVVAEDESVNRMDLVAMLEDSGYEVVGEAANGEEAVELTRKFRPSVVCMDVKMPRMDGIEAAGIICDENIAPVVMLTAFSQSDLSRRPRVQVPWHTSPSRMRNPSCFRLWKWPWAVSPKSTIARQCGAQRIQAARNRRAAEEGGRAAEEG